MCSTRLFKSLSSTHIVVVGLPLPQVFFVVLDSVNYVDVLLWTKRYASVYGDTVLLAPPCFPGFHVVVLLLFLGGDALGL